MRRGTYSIVAYDAASGELGVAVQSHWFAVGALVPWAQPGVGAVATQSVAEVAHGPAVLARLAEGAAAADALAGVLASDQQASFRQLGAVDSQGGAAAHTGAHCIAHAGHVLGDGVACQANIMATDAVPAAMAESFASREGDLADSLLAALCAAEDAGGDLRGRQSAALLVVPAAGEPWRARFDLRADDHERPLRELRRLLALARAYELAGRADELLAQGDRTRAGALYVQAAELAPAADELVFWAGIGLASDDLQAGVELIRRAAALKPAWLELLARLPEQLEPMAEPLRQAMRQAPPA